MSARAKQVSLRGWSRFKKCPLGNFKKSDEAAVLPETVFPILKSFVPAEDLVLPWGWNLRVIIFPKLVSVMVGGLHNRWKIDHIAWVTIEESEHITTVRFWQNTSKVHFDGRMRVDGKPLIYGDLIISLAHALSHNELPIAQCIAAVNSGTHANPWFVGITVLILS